MTKSSVLKSKRAYSKRKSKRRKARLTINKERQKDPTLKYKITEKEPLSFVNWCEEGTTGKQSTYAMSMPYHARVQPPYFILQ